MSEFVNTMLAILLVFHVLGEVVAALIIITFLTLIGVAWLSFRPAKSRRNT